MPSSSRSPLFRAGLNRALLAVLATFVILGPPSARAANKFWNGGTGNWNTSANWDPAGVPVNGDELFFPTLGAGAFTTTTNNIPGAARRFQSITFTAGGYIVRGNAIVVSNGVASVSGLGANNLSVDVTLAGHQTFANSSPIFTIAGDIALAGFNLTLDASDAGEFLVLSGAISGTGNLIKIGAGFFNLSGTNANTYTGNLTISQGELRLDKTDGLAAVTGDLSVSAGTTVRWFRDNQVANSADVAVGLNGSLVLNNHDETLGPLDLTGTTITTGTGILTMNGNVTNRASTVTTTISGNLSLGSSTRTLGIAAGLAVDELVLSANLSGGSSGTFPNLFYAGVVKAGDGRLVLRGTNTYGGPTTVNAGFVRAESDTAFGATFTLLGASFPGTTINPGGNISLESVDIGNEALIVNRPPPQASLSASGVSSWSGTVTLNTNVTFTTGGTLAFSNSISGPGGMELDGGTFRFAGTNANTYTGDTVVLDGTLQLAQNSTGDSIPTGALQIGDGDGSDIVFLLDNNQIGTGVDITISDSGLLNLNNFSDFTGDLIFEGGRVMTGSGTITPDNIIVNPTNLNATISGELNLSGTRTWTVHDGSASPCDLLVTAIISGTGSLIKNGDGTLCLDGNNTYTGTTTVNAGQLIVQHANALGATTGGTTVNSNALLTLEGGIAVGLEPLTLNSAGTINIGTLLSQLGANSWGGNIVLQADAIINVATAGDILTLTGAISGPGSLTKINAGVLTLGGAVGNTFGGLTFARQGTINLNKSAGAAVPNDLSIGLNGLIIGPILARVNNLDGAQINGMVTVNGTGTYDVNTFVESIDGLALNEGGNVIIDAAGQLEVFTGSVSASSGVFGGAAVISGAGEFAVGPGSRTFNVPEGTAIIGSDPAELVISAHLVGAANITKIGSGDMSLTASNSFTGSLTVDNGEVRISHDRALGATGGATRVNGDAVLSLSGSIDVLGESLTLDSTGQPANGALESTSGTNTWSGAVSLVRTAIINVETNSNLTLSGVLSGGGGVTKIGPGTLVYSGTAINVYTGTTAVNEGTMVLSRTGGNGRSIPAALVVGDGTGGLNADLVDSIGTQAQLNNLSVVTVNSSGLFRLSTPGSEIIGSLAGDGRVQLTGTDLSTGGNNASTIFDGSILGTGGLTKQGTGIFTLNGNHTYSGATLVAGGTLLVNGNLSNSDATVNASATLGGDGRVGDLDVNNLGNLAPGTSPGQLSSANTKLDPGSNFRVELNGPSVGTGYDQLGVVGTVDINGAQLILTKAPGYAPADSAVHNIILNDGVDAVVGTFGGRPEGSIITLGLIDFQLSYVGGTGNDVTLTVTNITLRFASSRVEAGNGNGRVDPNECDHLFIALENRSAATISGISARLDSLTPGVAVTQAESAYPNIAALGFGTNTTPFQIRTTPDFLCGQNILLSLVVTATGEGTFAVPFTLNSGTPGGFVTLNSTNVPKAILDLGTTNSLIIVTNQFPIRKVRVSLHATHPAAGDLRFRLRSPTGVEVLLSANRGGNVANYGNSCGARTIFDDDAPTKITAASAPFAGLFAPEENLAAFIGLNSSGTWRLFVDDTVAGDTGTLQCWSLLLAPGACTDGGGECESCLATIAGTLTPDSPTLPERIFRTQEPSGCGNIKLCPGGTFSLPSITTYRYNTHTFTNTGPDTCVTVVLTVPCADPTNALLSAAYLNPFLPSDLCFFYLGDSGNDVAGGSVGYSFRVPAGARFVVMVHELNPDETGQGCGNYTLQLYGLPCPPPVLHISHVETPPNRVRLFWSTAYPEFQLQRSASLNGTPPFPFVNVPTVPTVIGGDYNVTNSAAGNDDYFRLRRP